MFLTIRKTQQLCTQTLCHSRGCPLALKGLSPILKLIENSTIQNFTFHNHALGNCFLYDLVILLFMKIIVFNII